MTQQSKKTYQKLILPDLLTFNISSISRFNYAVDDSMKFITTERNIQIASNHFLDHQKDHHEEPQEPQQQDSLAILLQKQEPTTNSGKKKRVGCTCKKTFCLKMYCECFANSKTCNEDCVCCDCKNVNENKQIIQQAKESVKQKGIHSCSLSEKRCNCKKSFCQKKYCECFNAGISCSQACKCVECYNKVFVSKLKPHSEGFNSKSQIQHSQSFLQKSVHDLQNV